MPIPKQENNIARLQAKAPSASTGSSSVAPAPEVGAASDSTAETTYEILPLRLFRSTEQVFKMADSPSNRGGIGKLPKSENEALSMINLLAPKEQTGETVWIHYMEAANGNYIPGRYLFLGESTLKNIAKAAATGFAFMNSHRTGSWSRPAELPLGRTFCGRYESMTSDEGGASVPRAVVGIYMVRGISPNGESGPSTDAIHAGIDAGTIFDCSVGIGGGWFCCDVCGEDISRYIPYDPETKTGGDWACPHYPGTTYKMSEPEKAKQVARGVEEGVATCTLNDGYCGEVSAVYDGAVPGAGFAKVLRGLGITGEDAFSQATLQEIERAYGTLLQKSDAPQVLQRFPKLFSTSLVKDQPGKCEHFPDMLPTGQGEMVSPNQLTAKPGQGKNLAPGKCEAFTGTTAAESGEGGLQMSWRERIKTAIANFGKAVDEAGIPDEVEAGEGIALARPVPGTTLLTAEFSQPGMSAEDKAKMEQLERKQTELTAELAAANKRATEVATAAQLKEDLARVETLKREFKVTVAVGDQLAALAKDNPASFAASIGMFEANSPVVALAGNPDDAVAKNAADPALGSQEYGRLNQLAKEHAEKFKVNYAEAFSAVCKDNPELAAAYRAAQRGE